jgi:hypothetical protein
LERAARDGVTWQELAQSQIELFRGDMTDLHILPPKSYVGVVEAMELVVNAVEKLRDADTTYLVDSDIYFKVRSDSEFGSRSHLSQDQMLQMCSSDLILLMRLCGYRNAKENRDGRVHLDLDVLVGISNVVQSPCITCSPMQEMNSQ